MKHCCLMAVYLTCHASCAQPALVWWTWTQGLICPWGLALPEHHPKLILSDIRWNSPFKICTEGGSLSVLYLSIQVHFRLPVYLRFQRIWGWRRPPPQPRGLIDEALNTEQCFPPARDLWPIKSTQLTQITLQINVLQEKHRLLLPKWPFSIKGSTL